MQLEVQGLAYRRPPIEKSLQRIGVIGVMEENITLLQQADEDSITELLSNQTSQQHVIYQLIQPDESTQFVFYQASRIKIDAKPTIEKHTLIPLHSQSTLAEAYLLLVKKRAGGVYIYQDNPNEIMGIIPFDTIRSYLLKGKTN